MIAAGSSYEQILAAYPQLTYLDIFRAAQEALTSVGGLLRAPVNTLEKKRERYPRAYERWTSTEEKTLGELVRSGATVAQIVGRFQRNREAIRSRLVKLNLVDALTPSERKRFERITRRENDPSP